MHHLIVCTRCAIGHGLLAIVCVSMTLCSNLFTYLIKSTELFFVVDESK